MEQYVKEVKDLEFRKEKLLEQAKKIETLLSGKYIHYYRFVEDENGNYSEEKAWEMIEEFIDALRKYDVYFLSEEEEWDEEAVEMFALTEKDEVFFKSFFYCVLRWGYSGIGIHDSRVGKGSFEDFIEMAKEIRSNRNFAEEDLLYQEKYGVPWDNPFHTYDDVYSKVMGEPVYASAKEDVLVRMRQKYAKQIEKTEANWEEMEKELIAEYDGKMTLEEIYAYEEQQREFFADMDEMSRIQNESYQWEQKMVENFAFKEIFAEQYLLFRELYFQVDSDVIDRMQYIIEGMLDIYLYQKGLSGFLDDELFFKTFAMLRKTVGHVQQYLPEEVK